MDRNGDGSVDKKELFSWILRSFRSLSQEESTDRFHDTDDDQVSKFRRSRFTHKINFFFNYELLYCSQFSDESYTGEGEFLGQIP